MTMPWLMNCEHSPDGWCLRCVGKLHQRVEELELLETEQRKEIERLKNKKCPHELAREMSRESQERQQIMAKKTAKRRVIDSLSPRENNTMAAVIVAFEFIKGNVKRCGPDLTSDIVKGRLERALNWYEIEPREATVRMAAKAALNYINNTASSGREISAEEDLEKYLKKALKVYGITKSDIEWYKLPTTAEQPHS